MNNFIQACIEHLLCACHAKRKPLWGREATQATADQILPHYLDARALAVGISVLCLVSLMGTQGLAVLNMLFAELGGLPLKAENPNTFGYCTPISPLVEQNKNNCD